MWLTFAGTIVTAAGVTVAAYISRRNGQKLDKVHYLVNDRLDRALKKIEILEELARAREGGDLRGATGSSEPSDPPSGP